MNTFAKKMLVLFAGSDAQKRGALEMIIQLHHASPDWLDVETCDDIMAYCLSYRVVVALVTPAFVAKRTVLEAVTPLVERSGNCDFYFSPIHCVKVADWQKLPWAELFTLPAPSKALSDSRIPDTAAHDALQRLKSLCDRPSDYADRRIDISINCAPEDQATIRKFLAGNMAASGDRLLWGASWLIAPGDRAADFQRKLLNARYALVFLSADYYANDVVMERLCSSDISDQRISLMHYRPCLTDWINQTPERRWVPGVQPHEQPRGVGSVAAWGRVMEHVAAEIYRALAS